MGWCQYPLELSEEEKKEIIKNNRKKYITKERADANAAWCSYSKEVTVHIRLKDYIDNSFEGVVTSFTEGSKGTDCYDNIGVRSEATIVIPSGITSIEYHLVGGGGSCGMGGDGSRDCGIGANGNGGKGGGRVSQAQAGEYKSNVSHPVTPGDVLNVKVGPGGVYLNYGTICATYGLSSSIEFVTDNVIIEAAGGMGGNHGGDGSGCAGSSDGEPGANGQAGPDLTMFDPSYTGNPGSGGYGGGTNDSGGPGTSGSIPGASAGGGGGGGGAEVFHSPGSGGAGASGGDGVCVIIMSGSASPTADEPWC